jgi:hypothetical protein
VVQNLSDLRWAGGPALILAFWWGGTGLIAALGARKAALASPSPASVLVRGTLGGAVMGAAVGLGFVLLVIVTALVAAAVVEGVRRGTWWEALLLAGGVVLYHAGIGAVIGFLVAWRLRGPPRR